MTIKTVDEARLVIEVFTELASTELHQDAVWRMFGRMALPAIDEWFEEVKTMQAELEKLKAHKTFEDKRNA